MPTSLSDGQESAKAVVLRFLDKLHLEPRTLGRSDYPAEYPLKEVYAIARHCSGGLILGFEQIRVLQGVMKPDTKNQQRIAKPTPIPTPWNHLEAGILFGLGLPLLIFREDGVHGGIFDNGVTDVFVHIMPGANSLANDELEAVMLKWQWRVREHYYRDAR